jgi:DNA-binding NarL/FixJ family response regulator
VVQKVGLVRRHRLFVTTKLDPLIDQSKGFGSAKSAEAIPASISQRSIDTLLTQRQIDVLRLLANGKGNKEVASELGISTRTAESHRKHLMSILNCKTFPDLIRFAIRQGLVDL